MAVLQGDRKPRGILWVSRVTHQEGSERMAIAVSSAVGVVHPLEPLTVEELAAAADIVRTQKGLGPRVRFVTIALNEPPKDVVLAFPSGGPVDREAFVILL